jgi:hypothetical protein
MQQGRLTRSLLIFSTIVVALLLNKLLCSLYSNRARTGLICYAQEITFSKFIQSWHFYKAAFVGTQRGSQMIKIQHKNTLKRLNKSRRQVAGDVDKQDKGA